MSRGLAGRLVVVLLVLGAGLWPGSAPHANALPARAAAAPPPVPAPVPAPAPAPAPSPVPLPEARADVVVVGAAGLRWDDVGPDTPALERLADTAAVGAVSVKALPDLTCPADGWLTLGAGARADAFGLLRRPCPGTLRAPPDVGERNARSRDGARPGLLGEALGGQVRTHGEGARLAVPGPGVPDGALLAVVDAGSVGGPDRPEQLRRVDALVARVLAERPPGADLLVVGLAEGPGDDQARLHVGMATGPAFPRGALRSASTRRAPYVQLIDVAPTVLAALGRPVPAGMDGQPWTVTGPAPSVAALVDLDRRAVANKQATVPFFVALAVALLLPLLALRRRPRACLVIGLAGVLALGASYLSMLVPWWHAPVPLLALAAVTAGLAVPGAALLARGRAPVGAACLLVAGVLVLDLVTGASLQIDSVGGYSSLVAGRFAGIGNVAFGVYAASALLGTAAVAGRLPPRRAGVGVAVAGLVAVTVDGAPGWGSDVGGVLALLPAFVVLGLRLVGARLSVTRAAVAGSAAVALVTAFGLLDLTRPPGERSHLGRFLVQVADGTAGEVLRRKAGAVLALLFANPVTALLPLAVLAAVLLVRRPPAPLRRALDAAPWFRAALVAVAVAGGLGFALNDSGAAVPAMVLAVVVPATVAVTAGVALSPPASRPG